MKPPDGSVLCNSHPREALSGRIKDTQIKGSGFSPRTPALLLPWRVHTRNLHLVSSQNALLLKVIRHLSNAKVTIKRQGTCPLESASCPAPPFPGTPFPPHWPLQRLAVSRPRPRYWAVFVLSCRKSWPLARYAITHVVGVFTIFTWYLILVH